MKLHHAKRFLYAGMLLVIGFSCRELPTSPYTASNANLSLMLASSTGATSDTLVSDTVGNAITYTIATWLPEFIDSITFVVLESNNQPVFDTTITTLTTSTRDTTRIKKALTTSGDKKITATVYLSNHSQKSTSAKVKVYDKAIPATAPQWDTDTLRATITAGSSYTLDCADTCSDVNGDTLSYRLIAPATGTISKAVYTVTPADSTTITDHIIVSDSKGLSDTLLVQLTVKVAAISDTTAPLLTLVSPAKDSQKVSSSTLDVQVQCTDSSGISSVSCTMGTKTISVTRGMAGVYTAAVSGLAAGTNTLVFAAVDSSANRNIATRTFTIIYDPSMTDNVAPTVSLKNPSANNARLSTDTITVQIVCKDDNGISSITAVRSTSTALTVTNSSDSLYAVKLTGLTPGGYDTVTFTITDKSTNANNKVFSVVVNYDRVLTDITPTAPDNNTTGVGVKPTFKWTGGKDPDGSAVTYTVKYGTSPTAFTKTLTSSTDTSLTITSSLTSATVYYWMVIAKSSVNSDSAVSDVWKFTTADDVPTITTDLSGQSVVVGSKATFAIAATGGNLKYQWQNGSTDISGATSATYTTGITTPADDATTYRCIVSNSGGSDTSASAMLTILYTITYSGNGNTGGSVPIDSNTYKKGETALLKSNSGALTKTGYVFAGWTLSGDSNAVPLAAGTGTFVMRAGNAVFNVHWNGPPVWQTLPSSDTTQYTCTINLATFCKDPDGDTLVFTAKGTSVTLTGTTLQYVANGNEITVTATDIAGNEATTTFKRSFTNPPLMKLLDKGTFTMGDSAGNADEMPTHLVTLSNNFWMDSTEVTQGDYKDVLGGLNPSLFPTNDKYPVDGVTWFDAVYYCNQRSKKYGLDTVYVYTAATGTPGDGCTELTGLTVVWNANGFRLPTEAEWEYACRAGSTTSFFWGATEDTYNSTIALYYTVGNTDESDSTLPNFEVATKRPNAWRLYDMISNVQEWCYDWYSGTYYSTANATETDPPGSTTGANHVVRGSHKHSAVDQDHWRSAYRSSKAPALRGVATGFRCVRTKW